jgi:DNA-binding NarL/FixJ family response regulator
LLLDLAMPKLSGVEVLRELAQLRSPTRSIVLTGGISRRQTIEVLQAGAYGLVTKESPTQVLLKAIHTVVRGLHWMDNGPVTDVAAYLRGLMQVRATGSSNSSFGLTRRENEILGTIVGGLSNKEIAQRFSLSEDTVKHHLTNIFDKVGVSSRLELALFAIQHRLVEG